jgi:hypothetical protein
VELILVLFALVAIATPPLTIFLFWRQGKLRQQLATLTALSMELNDGLRRELLELKRQVAASLATADRAAPLPVEAPPSPHTVVPAPAEKPARAAAPAAPLPTEPVSVRPASPDASKTPGVPVPETRERVVAPPAKADESLAGKPSLPGPAIEQKPVPPPAAALPPSKPPLPPVPSERPEPMRPPASVLPPVRPPSPYTPPSAVQSPPSARLAPPPQFATLRSSAPRPTAEQRMKSVFALEETLGTNWLNKLGVIILVLGVALFGVYELGQLGPLGKVGLSYLVSWALLGGGIFLEKRERYRVLGHTLIGGGWALLFFTTYALNHVAAMRVLSSENTDLILMLGVALAMVVHTLAYRSQLVTGLAFLLAYSTVALSHDDVYSLSSGVVLAVGLVGIVIKMGWFELEVFGILSSYLNHVYWLYRLLGAEGAQGHAFPEYYASTALLLFYWLTYRISYVIRKTRTPVEEHWSTAAALLNPLLLLGAMKFQSVRPDLAFLALLVMGAVEFSIGQLPMIRRRREAFVALSVLGGALMMAAVPFRYSGNNVAILWLIGAEAFLAAGLVMGEVVFRRLGLYTGLLVGVHLAAIDFPQLLSARRTGEELVLAAGVMFGLCAAVFYGNALWVGQRYRRFFGGSRDQLLLDAHSYVGGFAAASAAWAVCAGDWTAVAFALIMATLAFLGRKLKSFHLQVQYGLLGLLSLYRVLVVNLHSDLPPYTHLRTRQVSLPFIAAGFYLTAHWAAVRENLEQRTFRGLFAAAGTGLVAALIYYEVPELWQPLAAIAFAVLLVEVGRWIGYHALAWHAHLLTGLAVLAALTADSSGLERWHDIPLHACGALPVVAGAYWIARRISLPGLAHRDWGRVAYTWVASGLMTWVLNEAVPPAWIAVSWVGFAVGLALVRRRIAYRQLAWQANAVAACALVRACSFNLALEQPLWSVVSLRLVTISLVAAGLYFLSRHAVASDSESSRAVSYLHTSAATVLLALLAWHEAPGGWLAAVWALFALGLALIDRRFELEDLRWQAHALAALTMLRSVSVNLYVTDTWHGIGVRLLSVSIVAVVLYALSRLIRMPDQWQAREFHHLYSWAASTLVSLLLWYELQPLSVAVGWAVFGLVLFEYGLWRSVRQFRFQAYIALAAAFGRIFFVNLTAGNPGEFWGPRIYTVLPITLILFFVYAQLGPEDQGAGDDRRWYFDTLVGYLGTGTVVALLYFQFPNDWLASAWAGVVFGLLGAALGLDRPIFLHQGLLLTLGVAVRGVMHNLFGASYFSAGDWSGRYLVLGSAIAILLACLPFAFRLRDRHPGQTRSSLIIDRFLGHPEQVLFFAPMLLLTLMLALKMRAGMVTVGWGIEGVLIVLLALAVGERSFRLTGLGLLLLCVGKVLVMDAWGLAPRDRYITFIILGMALLLVSFLYSKYREAIRQFL